MRISDTIDLNRQISAAKQGRVGRLFVRRVAAVEATKVALALVLLGALALRVWGIGFGLPHRYHIDEPFYVLGALEMGRGNFALTQPQNSPNLWQFVLLIEYGALYLVGHAGRVFAHPSDMATLYKYDPSVFYLLARWSSVLVGVATVGVVYLIGKRVFDRLTGILAALLLAMTFTHARESHYAVSDALVVLFTTLSVYAALAYLLDGNRRVLLGGLLVLGAATGMKYRPVAFALPLLLALIWRAKDEGKLRTLLGLGPNLLLGVAFALGFVIGYPGIIISRVLAQKQVADVLSLAGVPGYSPPMVPLGFIAMVVWADATRLLWVGMGPPMLVAALIGMGLALRARRFHSVLLMVAVIAYFVLMGLTRLSFVRYTLPMVPLLAIFAAWTVRATLKWMASRDSRRLVASAALLTALLIAWPLAETVRHDYLLTQEDTRTIAKAWIEQNIPAGSKIAMDGAYVPPLTGPSHAEPDSRHTYDVTWVKRDDQGLSAYPLDAYRLEGFEYLITSSFVTNWQADDRYRFYAALDRQAELVQKFAPNLSGADPAFTSDEIYGPIITLWERDRPGPVIKIYRLAPMK